MTPGNLLKDSWLWKVAFTLDVATRETRAFWGASFRGPTLTFGREATVPPGNRFEHRQQPNGGIRINVTSMARARSFHFYRLLSDHHGNAGTAPPLGGNASVRFATANGRDIKPCQLETNFGAANSYADRGFHCVIDLRSFFCMNCAP